MPITIILRSLDLKKPDAAFDVLFPELGLSQLLEEVVQILNLLFQGGGTMTQSQGDEAAAGSLIDPLHDVIGDRPATGADTERTPSQPATRRLNPDFTGDFMHHKPSIGATGFIRGAPLLAGFKVPSVVNLTAEFEIIFNAAAQECPVRVGRV